MLATIATFAAAGRLNRYTSKLDVAKPGTTLLGPIRAKAVRTKSELASAVFFPVQYKDAKLLGVGKLLVASRSLGDPNFAKTVILLVHSDDQGIVGLILNRRTELALSRVLEGLPGTKDRSDPVYLGGPVEVPAVSALLQSPTKVEGADHIFGGVYLINTKTILEQTLAARPAPQVFHVYLGYAGWTNDQLRNEVKLGAWFIFPADTEAVFNSDPGSLWPQMIRKTEQKIAESKPASAEPWTRACPSVELVRIQACNK
jgi:putative transcriptional regulator